MTPEQLAEIKAQIRNAHDLIISAALDSGAALVAEIERLQQQLAEFNRHA